MAFRTICEVDHHSTGARGTLVKINLLVSVDEIACVAHSVATMHIDQERLILQ
jgi:hypothetical protein